MGGVYAAVDTTTGKRIALKTTARDATATVIALCKREYQTLHGLRHPNIVPRGRGRPVRSTHA
jgi:serine/threonine protein kinase